MKLTNLALQRPIIRRRHNLLTTAGRSQAALRYQSAPREQLVRRDAAPASHQANCHPWFEGLLDHPNLLRSGPTTAPLNRGDDLNVIRRAGHKHGCKPHTCEVGDRVRSFRGLSQAAVDDNCRAAAVDQW